MLWGGLNDDGEGLGEPSAHHSPQNVLSTTRVGGGHLSNTFKLQILSHASSGVIKLLTSNKCSCTTEMMGNLFIFLLL